MTIDEMIAVLQAAKARKQIQYKHHSETEWYSVPEPLWDFNQNDYRVKPEPREWTLHKPDDPTLSALGNMNAVPYNPERGTKCAMTECRPIRVREVLP